LDASEYQKWQVRWRSAKEDVRSAAEIAKRLGALSDEIERDLILVGATAIEDKLQVGMESWRQRVLSIAVPFRV
jgi:phospholipid-translocating ATPase